ncbi:MAG: DRTGG domain-containing protein [Clostridia bacterium]|nr:DRTGG domain-containing protein [Clostridia bacterium]
MKVKDIIESLNLNVLAGAAGVDGEVSGCYIGDLLSLAMSSLKENNVWITIQTNVNIVAVSVLAEGACVILCDGQEPDDTAKTRADTEGMPILSTEKSAYELAAALSRLGI